MGFSNDDVDIALGFETGGDRHAKLETVGDTRTTRSELERAKVVLEKWNAFLTDP